MVQQLKMKMTQVVRIRTGAVRKVVTADGHPVKSLEEFVDGGHYVCCGAEPLDKVQISEYLVAASANPGTKSTAHRREETGDEEEVAEGAAEEGEGEEEAEVTEAIQQLAVQLPASSSSSAASSLAPSPLPPSSTIGTSPARSPAKKVEKFGVQAEKARVIHCFRNGDKHHKGERITLNMKLIKTFDQLKQQMTVVVKPVTGAIRKVYTVDGVLIKGLDEFADGESYICCAGEPLDREQMPTVLHK